MKLKSKYVSEVLVRALMILSIVAVVAFVISILYIIFHKGIQSITWAMITQLPQGGFFISGEGGFLNAIVGSLYIVLAATVLGLLISVPIVVYLNIYLKKDSRLGYFCRLTFDVLYGIPSIVYGAFAFIIMIAVGMKPSLLAGIVVTTMLIIPIMVRSMDEVAREFPRRLLDVTYSMGATRWEAMRVVLRQIMPGLTTATLLSVGRAIGDTAAVMFTAGFSDFIPKTLGQQTATLPLSIFNLLTMPSAKVQEKAYAAALVLTIIVLIISLTGRYLSGRVSKNKI
ncbi:MAG: ABC transporter permease subunit [Bacteroidales bacterium]|nr:ABC transporter permease subunit [Bacteroidales bacterium]